VGWCVWEELGLRVSSGHVCNEVLFCPGLLDVCALLPSTNGCDGHALVYARGGARDAPRVLGDSKRRKPCRARVGGKLCACPPAQVRTVPVQARGVPLSELRVRAPRVEELSSVEASLRLDAVASAGFRVSRSKMMDLIKSGGWGREGPAAHVPCLHAVGTSSPRPPRDPTMCEKGLLCLGCPNAHHERSRVFQANCW
jgi:hypothetical protein